MTGEQTPGTDAAAADTDMPRVVGSWWHDRMIRRLKMLQQITVLHYLRYVRKICTTDTRVKGKR